jgi:hypothetical protein
MKKYSEFILESRHQSMQHHNITPHHLKSLVDTSSSKRVRYVIDHHDRIHAGDAAHHVHHDLASEPHISGVVYKHGDNYHHYSRYENDWQSSDPKEPEHKHIDRLKQLGVTHRKLDD